MLSSAVVDRGRVGNFSRCSPRETFFDGVLNHLDLNCFSCFSQDCRSRVARHLSAHWRVNLLSFFSFSSYSGPTLGRPASRHFLQAASHLELSSLNCELPENCFLFLVFVFTCGVREEAATDKGLETKLRSSPTSDGEL